MWEANVPYSTIVAIVLASSSRAYGSSGSSGSSNTSTPDLSWYQPNGTSINNLTAVINGTGVFGFQFQPVTPPSLPPTTYNWCNMPHVHPDTYPVVSSDDDEYKLEYVEVIQRHHKRTPYAANTFPHETYAWYCDDEALAYAGIPIPDSNWVDVAWNVYTSPVNPFAASGFIGSCQFPQITAGGLSDSRQHGKDLFSVYHDQLGFLPSTYDPSKVSYRVTNNVITSQVASQLILGMYPDSSDRDSNRNKERRSNRFASQGGAVNVLIQPDSVDSLEPGYTCPAASDLYSSYGVGSTASNWTAHLTQLVGLFEKLDSVSGIGSTDSGWHKSFDHYFDNLSARLCHEKPLPCEAGSNDNDSCITQDEANAVFRAGQYEYSFIYRDSPGSLAASTYSYGVWVAELSANLKAASASAQTQNGGGIIYRHNVAHDGSISRLLSILQVDVMVWPGMGSEIVFELYSSTKHQGQSFIRVLFGGQILRSSNPTLGYLNLVPLSTLTDYIDGLVGVNAVKVPGLCED